MTTFERFAALTHVITPTPDERYERDLYAVTHPEVWIKWPVFPMIRLSDTEAGILTPSRGPVIYLINMFMLKTGPLKPQLKGQPTVTYDTFEQLVTDWRGD